MLFEKYFEPQSVSECVELLREYGESAKIVAGGTDIVPKLKAGEVKPKAVISIAKLPDIDAIEVTDSGLRLGAMARLRKISLDKALEKDYKVLMEAAGHVSSMQVRNVATIGGNACNASPGADAVEGLMLLDAVAVIANASGTRETAISEFFTGPGKTVLESGELLTGFKIPAPKPRTGAFYEKYAIRGDTDISIIGAGARVTLNQDGTIAEARISLASVAPTPLRMQKAEAMLLGKKPTGELIAEVAAYCAGNINPITDQRATAEYRREMVRVWTAHALEKALERAQ